MKPFIQLKQFPIESEATVRIGQYQVSQMSREDLERYAKQSFMVLSQLTYYTEQLIEAIEELGIEVLPAAE